MTMILFFRVHKRFVYVYERLHWKESKQEQYGMRDSSSLLLLLWLFIIYLHTKLGSLLSQCMFLFNWFCVCDEMTDWLVNGWELYFFIAVSAVATLLLFITDISVKTFYVKFQHCIVTTSNCFRKRQQYYSTHWGYVHMLVPLLKRSTLKTKAERKQFTYTNGVYNWMKIFFKWFFWLLRIKKIGFWLKSILNFSNVNELNVFVRNDNNVFGEMYSIINSV